MTAVVVRRGGSSETGHETDDRPQRSRARREADDLRRRVNDENRSFDREETRLRDEGRTLQHRRDRILADAGKNGGADSEAYSRQLEQLKSDEREHRRKTQEYQRRAEAHQRDLMRQDERLRQLQRHAGGSSPD